MNYDYQARVVRVIDGDTVVLNVDLGFRTWHESAFRLAGIDAPEVNAPGPAGEAARFHLKALLPVGSLVRVVTEKAADKYGRWLATVWANGPDWPSANARMVEDGYAVPYDGGLRG